MLLNVFSLFKYYLCPYFMNKRNVLQYWKRVNKLNVDVWIE